MSRNATVTRPRSVVAAATTMYGRPGTKLEVKPHDWQHEAWRLYDLIGAARFVANTVANAVSRCRLYIAELDPDTGEIIGDADEPALRPFVASPFGTGDRRRENIRLAALNLYVAGEYYQVGEAPRADGERDRWYIVSGFDFEKKQGGGHLLRCDRPPMAGGGKAELDPGTEDQRGRDIIARVWTPHPKHAHEADSPFRAAIPDLNILNTIKKREGAELDSRLAGAGVMFIPDSFDLPSKTEGTPGTVQDLMDEFVKIASEVISDPSHPSSIVPYIMQVPGDEIEKVRIVNFWSELSDSIGELSDRKIRALAQAFDAPVETLEGTGNTNHWNLWRIAEETITTHYEPILSRIADSATTVYLRPGLKRTSLNGERYAYAFDTTPLRVRADRFGDALKLRELGLLSDAATLKAGDFNDADAPDEKETTARLARQLITAHPALIETAPELAELAGLRLSGSPVVIDADRPPRPAPRQPAAPEVEQQGPPEQPDPGDEPGPPAALVAAADGGVIALASAAVMNALRVAGGRLARTWPHGADRSRLHLTLASAPHRGAVQRALRGVWDDLPEVCAGLDVDPEQLRNALNAYTVEIIVRRCEHDPARLAGMLSMAGMVGAGHE
mgnify:CR=1 FL=1